MEKKKINFSNIKGMLSNDQMKSIKGGSAGDPGCGTVCTINLDNGRTEPGICGTYESTCACFATGYIQFGTNGCL
ncbi:hypothetical protein [Mucilaginibacter sp. L196]|uniref:hypothetical protein n=1 Tax=Mucilaginibacter sp. L196 TaxID=1641870 RepID=UPI00131C7F0B|nr:hypothetical protein [Mucilaginibacter sp. L196]